MVPASSDISVTISLYNKEKTIERALLSVLNQSSPPKNVIIVDDGSTDHGSELAENLARKYPSVSHIVQENQGVSVARNRGVVEADTDYVCFLDADDVWEKNYMDNLLNLMSAEGNAEVYCLAYQMKSEIGYLKPHVALEENHEGIVENPLNVYAKGYGLIHTSAICFRKEFFLDIGGFPEGVNFGEDLFVWMIACLKGKVAFSNKISVTLHKEQINSINRRKLHPYHVSYFTEHLNDFSTSEQQAIRKFLIGNIYIQWAAAKLEGNVEQQKTLQKYCFSLSKTSWLILTFSRLLPPSVFKFLKNRRTKKRLIGNR
ncbi:MAG: glycosyltransferase family 2 protein [Balneolaceae bacterium]|nr:MAG: glycosyltransferase family 2 protein [Balneolaceae bacterium]